MNFLINWEERYHVGGEAWLGNMLALRGGYMFRYDSFGLTAGAGVKVPLAGTKITADVAWQQSKHDLESTLAVWDGLRILVRCVEHVKRRPSFSVAFF